MKALAVVLAPEKVPSFQKNIGVNDFDGVNAWQQPRAL